MADQILGLEPTPEDQKKGRTQASRKWDVGFAAVVMFWTGVVLLLAGLFDSVLALYPPMFGSPEWEFATVSGVIAGLPLITIGLVGVWAGSGVFGRRWLSFAVGSTFLVGALCVVGMLVLFALDIPIALRATQNLAQGNIKQLVAKTMALGCMFATAYIVAGIMALRQARTRNQ